MKYLSILNLKHIRKEQLRFMQFEKEDVLKSKEQHISRDLLIQNAQMLGNLFKHAVRIVFHTKREICVVETTVKDRTPSNLILKDNILLPVNCIYEIIF